MKEDVVTAITSALPGARVTLLDPREDGIHLEAIVVAEEFEGLSLLEQHRLVMRALSDQFESALHALRLTTYSPGEWQSKHEEELHG